MDPLLLTAALVAGLAARAVGLPPLVGYLGAGFGLSAAGLRAGAVVQEAGDLGITLLLFSIGLKLRPRDLAEPRVWGTTLAVGALTTGAAAAVLLALGRGGLPLLDALDARQALLIGFALAFSSTVFAVKALDAAGESVTVHGRLAIGILVVQDLLAAAFLALSTGEIPSPWVLAVLPGLVLARPLLGRALGAVGHGELLVLFGLVAGLAVGYVGFELVGVKGDLGALFVGALLAPHPKARELSDALFSLKDLFLVGFFLSIGMSGTPAPAVLLVALPIALLGPAKGALFTLLLTRFRVRARASFLASLPLATHSEFGLVVAVASARLGWLDGEWPAVLAVALTVTFVGAAQAAPRAHGLWSRVRASLERLEHADAARACPDVVPPETEVVVCGMGRVGTGAYDEMRRRQPGPVLGVDVDEVVVRRHREAGRDVVRGSVLDPEFLEELAQRSRGVRLVLLALPEHAANLRAARQLEQNGFAGTVGAVATWPDQAETLRAAGVEAVYDFYSEAGAGLAEHVCEGSSGAPA